MHEYSEAIMSDFTPLTGWAGAERPDLLRESFDLWGGGPPQFAITGMQEDKPPIVRLFDYTRQVLGKDTENYAQQIGDCVSFSGKNNTEYVQALPIINGALEEFKNTFPPYFYGVSRVQIGGGKIWGDGSLGSWLAAGLLKYGVLRADFNGVPAYSGSIAKSWGKSGPPSQFLEEGKLHLVNTAGQINGKQDAAAAIQNGYPCICCSNRGFKMQAGSDGFHAPSGVWGHALTLIAYSAGDPSKNIEEHFCILNSWADVHGKIKDFHDPSVEWPIGTLRVRANVVDGMIKQGDSFAVSPFQGFPAQKLPRSAFDLW